MSLARRTVASISWRLVANSVDVIVRLVRSILLARWLPVDVFGIYSYAWAIVDLSSAVIGFVRGEALLNRVPETEDVELAAAVFFTLRLIVTLVWVALLVAGALMLTDGLDRVALLLLTLTTGAIQLADTPTHILLRRVVHRRLSLIVLANTLLATLIALALAWQGVHLWALLAINLVTVTVTLIGLYTWKPVWRPRLAWSPPIVRYLLSFGSHFYLVGTFWSALERIDDLWTRIYLGVTSLGFYSRAYSFATYPRTILASPITSVAGGALAELKGDRLRLSRYFFQINALLVRSGFLIAGLLALVSPELIRLVLGHKWLPMLDAFRLMLVFSLLYPLRKILLLFFTTTVGKPEQMVPSLFIQLLVLVVGLFVLGPRLGIAGVALAVDAMLVVGIAILFWQAKTYVDFSLKRLFAAPGLALTLGMVVAHSTLALPGVLSSDWRSGFVKFVVFSGVYSIILFVFERRQFAELLSLVERVFHTMRFDEVWKQTRSS